MKMTFEVRLDWILRLSQVSFIWLVLRKGNGPVYVRRNRRLQPLPSDGGCLPLLFGPTAASAAVVGPVDSRPKAELPEEGEGADDEAEAGAQFNRKVLA